MNDYGHYCRPGLASLLEALSLDATYEYADGDRLGYRRGGDLVEVLDLVGGFGANLFGHYHPELVAEERRLTEARVPMLAQGSCRTGAARLAKALCDRLGDYVVIFTNTGAEAIEAAIKHASLERRRSTFWAVERAFHGKTLGAIQLTSTYRGPFSGFGPQVRFLNPDDPADWEAAADAADDVSAAFIEPIQGEGGVYPLPPEFVKWLGEICRKKKIPLIVDEIQTGMGRTGTFLASEPMGINPDYLCLSKALGGGLAKIGALLIRRERFIPDFSLKHTSTFAEDDRGCLIALKALEILERDDLPGLCLARGQYLLDKLEALRAQFPRQIKEVRGRGLMIGVELEDLSDSISNTLRMLSQQNYLGYLAAAYLLHVHRIRVGPTLSQPWTIRVEPSGYISEADLDSFVNALRMLCEALQATDLVHLTGFQVGLPPAPIVSYNGPRPFKREPPRTERRVAFIGHLLTPEHAYLWDPSLRGFKPAELAAYMAKPSRILGPTIFDQAHVHSQTGEEVHFNYIGLDLTPPQIMTAMRARDTGWIMQKIEAAAVLAKEAGCQALGLGAYTSIVSGNCQRVKTNGITLTSGNSLTVGMGILALQRAAAEAGLELSTSSLAIIGATGNIATTYALMMAPHVKKIVLVVHDLASPRLQAVISQIRQAAPDVLLSTADNLDALRECQLIVTASNSPTPLIYPQYLAPGLVVICDISLPSDVAPEVSLERPDVMVIHGGVIRLPHNDDFTIAGIPLEKGHVYACMAETLLIGLEEIKMRGSYGPVTVEGVEQALAVADKHGFTLSQFKPQWRY